LLLVLSSSPLYLFHSAEIKEAFLKLIVPLLMHRTDIEVTVSTRLHYQVTTDLRIAVKPLGEVRRLRVAKLQSCKAAKLQSCKAAKLQSCKAENH
jgi:hypothetical protein